MAVSLDTAFFGQMNRNGSLFLLTLLFVLCSESVSASCARKDPEIFARDIDTLFIAFLTEGHFVEGNSPSECGWIEGTFEVARELKGDPSSVRLVRRTLRNCDNTRFSGNSDAFPIGKYVFIGTNTDVASINGCSYVWDDYPASCFLDSIQRHLDIEADDPDLRAWCVEDEQSGGRLSRVESELQYLQRLERERDALLIELEEMDAELERLGESLSQQ